MSIKTYANQDWVNEKISNTLTFHEIKAYTPYPLNWTSMAYGDGKFIAVGASERNYAYSTDGIVWIMGAMPTTRGYQKAITYGNGRFVVVERFSNKAMYSDDGITWALATMPSESWWQGVVYGGDKFVAVSNDRFPVIAYSTDGVVWNKVTSTLPGLFQSASAITYGNGMFVIVSESSSKALYSTDGITWKSSGLNLPGYGIETVTYGNGKFVAISSDTDDVAYSIDGTWPTSNMTKMPDGINTWTSVFFGNDKFVAVANGAAAYSTDGMNWIRGNIPANNWVQVTYGNDKFVAVSPTREVAYSTDGITWITGYTELSQNSQDVTDQVRDLLLKDFINNGGDEPAGGSGGGGVLETIIAEIEITEETNQINQNVVWDGYDEIFFSAEIVPTKNETITTESKLAVSLNTRSGVLSLVILSQWDSNNNSVPAYGATSNAIIHSWLKKHTSSDPIKPHWWRSSLYKNKTADAKVFTIERQAYSASSDDYLYLRANSGYFGVGTKVKLIGKKHTN